MGGNYIKKIYAHWKCFFIILSIVLLLSSCVSEQTEQIESDEVQFTAIPVSPYDFDSLMDRGAPWVVTMMETGEPLFVMADNVFQAEDGTDMLFATIPVGSGIISTMIQGYDPVSGRMYTLCERFFSDYRFFIYENELFVAENLAFPDRSGRLVDIFRPVLNHENLSFDLIQIDDELFTLILQQGQ